MTNYVTLGVALASLGLLAAFMVLGSRFHYTIKMVVMTVAVAQSLLVWSLWSAMIGFPIHDYPKDGTVVIAVHIDDGKAIDLWMRDPQGPRAYALPYDSDTAKKLQDQQDKAKREDGVMIFHRGNGSGGGKGGPQGRDGQRQGNSDRNQASTGTSIHGGNDEMDVSIDVIPAMPPKES